MKSEREKSIFIKKCHVIYSSKGGQHLSLCIVEVLESQSATFISRRWASLWQTGDHEPTQRLHRGFHPTVRGMTDHTSLKLKKTPESLALEASNDFKWERLSSRLLSSEHKSLLRLHGPQSALDSVFRTHRSHQQKPQNTAGIRVYNTLQPSSTWSNLDVFKGNIHGLFFPILEEKRPPAAFFTQTPQGLAGGRGMGWWGGRGGRRLKLDTAWPTTASGPATPSASEPGSAELSECPPHAPYAMIVTYISVSTYKKCAPSQRRPSFGVWLVTSIPILKSPFLHLEGMMGRFSCFLA